MSVLDEIIAGVKEDLAERKIPRSEIEAAAYGAAPVIAIAIHDAIGVWLRKWPFSPENILKALGTI